MLLLYTVLLSIRITVFKYFFGTSVLYSLQILFDNYNLNTFKKLFL